MVFNKKWAMKQAIIGMMLMVVGLTASAQFTTEMLDQIAALQAYLQVAAKGLPYRGARAANHWRDQKWRAQPA
jgi:hypothetical protein